MKALQDQTQTKLRSQQAREEAERLRSASRARSACSSKPGPDRRRQPAAVGETNILSLDLSGASDALSDASTPQKECVTQASPPCSARPVGTASSRGSNHSGHWESEWEANGLERRQIKSAVKESRHRFIDDNRFGCHFTATGMPFTSCRSPRLHKVRDREALASTLLESQKRAASLPSARPAHGAVEKHTPGQLPGYLVRRKLREQRRSEEEQQARLAQRAKPPPGFRLVPAAERAAAEKATRKLLEETMALFLKVSHDVPASSAQGSPAIAPPCFCTRHKLSLYPFIYSHISPPICLCVCARAHTHTRMHTGARRRELEKTITGLEAHLSRLTVDCKEDGSLMVPEALSLVPPGPQPKLVSEGQRIKLLQSGPAII